MMSLVVITFSQPVEETAIVLNHARSVKAKAIVITDYVEAELAHEDDIILFVKRGEVGHVQILRSSPCNHRRFSA